MSIIINNNINLSFDYYGNLYVNDTFQLNIENDNKLCLDKGDYHIIETSSKPKVLNIQQKHSTLLHDKITNENSSEEENYYPENSYDEISTDEEINEDNIKQYGQDNHKFVFKHDFPDNTIVNNRNDGDIMSLYDTYIYNGEQLVVKSCSPDNSSIYVLKIYYNGDVYFRQIGSSEKLYKFHVSDDNVEIK